MFSNAQYHALHDDENDSADLWDQLDDVESREVQQHQSRFRVASPDSRTNAGTILVSMVKTSAEQIRATVLSAWSAQQESWRRHRRRFQNNNSIDLDQEFGIGDLRPTDFEVENGQQPEDTDSRNPFVVLSNFPRQAISSARDSHGLVSNLDVFLSHLYQYYYHRGLVPIVCNFVVEVSTLLFTLWFSRILIKYVDWRELAACKVCMYVLSFPLSRVRHPNNVSLNGQSKNRMKILVVLVGPSTIERSHWIGCIGG
eukprot:scaffold2816_cov121-Cylindrotheca_fusiformis.AAC.51